MCECIVEGSVETRDRKIAELLSKHNELLEEQNELLEALIGVLRSK